MPLSRREFVGGAAAVAVARFFGLSEEQAAAVIVDAQTEVPDDTLVFVMHGSGRERYMTIEGKVFNYSIEVDNDIANIDTLRGERLMVSNYHGLTFETTQPFRIRVEED